MNRLLLLNPEARRAERGRELLGELALERGTELREVSGPGDAAELARRARAEGVARIVVAGGDGTLQEVVNGLDPAPDSAAARPSLGLLPLGTGNDMARSLGIPLGLEEARTTLEEGIDRTIDLGQVSTPRQRCFVNSAIGGVGGLVERRLSRRVKKWLGVLSYPLAALVALRNLPRYRVTVEWDGGRGSIRTDAYSVLVANGRYAGGGLSVAPAARMDDGRLDLLVIEAGKIRRVPGLARALLTGTHVRRPDVTHVRAESVALRSRPPLWVSLDGEVLGNEALEIEVVPAALRVSVPPPGGGDARRR